MLDFERTFDAAVPMRCLAAAGLFGLVACSGGYVGEGADGGETSVDGDVGGVDTLVDAGSPTETGSTVDGGTDGDVPPSNSCGLEGDWTIRRDEVTFEVGVKATFRVAEDVSVETEGARRKGGRHWDFEKNYSGDRAQIIEFQKVEGQWFASEFPKADYAMRLTASSEELGLFRTTSDALLLLGVVSPDDDYRKTNISYDPPVEVLKFPLEPGTSWKTETTASGTHETWSPVTPITYEEIYRNQVDAKGRVETPYGRFQALRVRTVLERSGAAGVVPLQQVRTFAFVAECFGTIATIRSKPGETKTEFDEAAEIRRLSK